MKKINRKGFTIVELVIVIAVIAILAGVLIPTFSGVVNKANQSAAQQVAMQAVKSSLLMTNTATLPDKTFVLLDTDKNVGTKPDIGYTYNGNSLGDAVNPYNNSVFNSSLITGVTTILLSDKAYTVTVNGGTATFSDINALIISMLKEATGKDTITFSGEVEEGKVTSVKVTASKTNTSNIEYTVYTSVDMPKNVIVFVPLG